MQAHAFGGPVLCGKSCIANRSYVPVWKRARLSSVAGKALASKCIQLQTITQATLEKEENAHSEAEIDRAVPCNSASSSSTSNDLRNSTQNADSQLKSNAWIDKFALSTAAMLFMSASSAAAAAELAAYDPGSSVDFVKNAAGIGYIGLLAYFCFRLFNKRSKFATSERIAKPATEESETDEPAVEKEVSPLDAAWGSIQAGVVAFVLWQLATRIDGYFGAQEMPSQYTARNITITLRTIVTGLSYLATFIFSFNSVGLMGLAVQLAFFPEAKGDGSQEIEEN